MEMKYISESGSTDVGGAKRKKLCKIINNLCIDNYEILSEEQRGILKNELKNTFKKFIQVSREEEVVGGVPKTIGENVEHKLYFGENKGIRK